ncbi:hypothetical protein [Leuconostoc mesenteroides]|uniref:hypothetical protein n=1 Tax=Leuconostoc mesenteroides TaxID=1245 RepID=UPI0007755E35|nr:hypothetical protein [Leuconostoc mesenteroides]MBZ1518160.1 hypothetical protein [Leuconostoc mesenteroides]MBZ1521071.1 hypothetical protein [Leuconostoc mesenteroides]MBZ1522957.1 hypothetical protein [Leuconostoc mesenteroides]TGD34942.1 hypothetical protein EIA53_05320 [Leuconostoc mesenteroides]
MSGNNEDFEEREGQKAYFAKQNGYFECVGCGSVLNPSEMSSLPNLCKNCKYDNDKHDKFEKNK